VVGRGDAGIVAQLFQADPTATLGAMENSLIATAHKYTDGLLPIAPPCEPELEYWFMAAGRMVAGDRHGVMVS